MRHTNDYFQAPGNLFARSAEPKIRYYQPTGGFRPFSVLSPSGSDDRFGVCNLSGDEVLPAVFSSLYIQESAFAVCFYENEPDAEPVFIDLKTGMDLRKIYGVSRILQISHNRRALVLNEKEEYGLVDSSGKQIIPFGYYQELNSYGPGFLYSFHNGGNGAVSWDGEEILPCSFDDVCPPYRTLKKSVSTLDILHLNVKANFDLIPVRLGDKWTYVGRDGKRFDIGSDDLGPFTEKGYAIVGRGVANDCVIDMKGNIVYSLWGCYLQWLNEDYLLFYPKNAKGNCGITDLQGNIIFPPVGDICPEKHGLIRITMKSPDLIAGEPYWNAIYKIEDGRLVQLVPGSKWLLYVGENIYVRNSRGNYDRYSMDGIIIQEDDCDGVLF